MATTPVTIAYEYERPRFEYSIPGPNGSEDSVKANYCVRRDGQYVFGEVTDFVSAGRTVELRFETVATCDVDAIETPDGDQVGTDTWELQVIRPPSLLERIVPWWWPPDVAEFPFAEPTADDELVHPDESRLGSCSVELLHSLDVIPPAERPG
ncbi:hypothetical protein [Halorientalis sp.]|jgi:hypothetical protein|uniref:hypothetical protein n=1 Tax=Halorientalis sp. TaxID=1931229 RepID=UPI0026271457|nr:hypothetical protein [Halorientalis sp.]